MPARGRRSHRPALAPLHLCTPAPLHPCTSAPRLLHPVAANARVGYALRKPGLTLHRHGLLRAYPPRTWQGDAPVAPPHLCTSAPPHLCTSTPLHLYTSSVAPHRRQRASRIRPSQTGTDPPPRVGDALRRDLAEVTRRRALHRHGLLRAYPPRTSQGDAPVAPLHLCTSAPLHLKRSCPRLM